MSYTSVRCRRSRLRSALGTLLALLAVVGTVEAQDLSGLAGIGSSFTNGVRITPEIQVGYQKLGLSFNLPAIRDSSILPRSSTLDLALRKAALWCGALDVVVDFPSVVSLGLKAQTNARKNADVYERQDYVEGSNQGVHWTAEKLQWWTIDGRLMYRFKPSLSAVAGLRHENLSFDLTDPTTDQGEHLNLDETGGIFGFPYYKHWRYSSSLASQVCIPYLGINFIGNGYKASLIGSPCASVNLRIPAAYFTDLNIDSYLQWITGEHWEYRVTKPAVFLEANFSHDINVSQALTLSVWGTASWLSLRGKGTWSYLYRGQVPPDPPGSDEPLTETNTATFTRYLLGGGLSAVVSF